MVRKGILYTNSGDAAYRRQWHMLECELHGVRYGELYRDESDVSKSGAPFGTPQTECDSHGELSGFRSGI
jgi:hypothetical protein